MGSPPLVAFTAEAIVGVVLRNGCVLVGIPEEGCGIIAYIFNVQLLTT